MELEIMKNKDKKNGFTLVELLVAMATFSLIMLSVSTISISVIKTQRRVFVMQNVQESAGYILETMNKEIRASEIISASGDGLISLSIINSNGDSIDYQFSSDKIQRRVNAGVWQDLSPSDLEVVGGFYVTKESFPARALVTTVMKIGTVDGQVEEEFEMDLQSTIASRRF
ncbi:type II secretion system GspH family protein [Patescibacteria group bacterium]|nr:type II secretion system GspH family protein [Patescibacteria group bacterium]